MKKGKEKRPKKPDPKEVRAPLETNGMSFNEVLKRLSNTKPEEVSKIETDLPIEKS